MTHDRVEGDELAPTHEFLSYMLGVRRSGITEVLQSLQNQGLIRYGQGKITVRDRGGLEELACECYQCVQDEYKRLSCDSGKLIGSDVVNQSFKSRHRHCFAK